MHALVLLTGDLYKAMAVHVVYDFLAGLMLMRLARRDGLLPARTPSCGEAVEESRIAP